MTDQELIGYLEKIREEIRALRDETVHRDNSLREELRWENRQTRVLVEGLRSDLQLVAEGVVGMGERLDEHKNEVLAKFEEVKATIAPYYVDLHRRVTHLETKTERWDRNVMDVIRERLVKR